MSLIVALEKHGEGPKNEQEILLLLADITMESYAMDSALCRASKTDSAAGKWIAETFVNDALPRIPTGQRTVLIKPT